MDQLPICPHCQGRRALWRDSTRDEPLPATAVGLVLRGLSVHVGAHSWAEGAAPWGIEGTGASGALAPLPPQEPLT